MKRKKIKLNTQFRNVLNTIFRVKFKEKIKESILYSNITKLENELFLTVSKK